MTQPIHRRPPDVYPANIAECSTVAEAAQLVSRIYNFASHPYFVWARHPETTLEQFRHSQIPYMHFVEHFSRGLTAVLARVEDMQERIATVFENVQEEHGGGNDHQTHRNTFRGYLKAIGVPDTALEERVPPRIAMHYQALLDYCLTHTGEEGAAAIGIVEYTHINVAGMLRALIHDRFWGDVDAQYHYSFHEELDHEHADDLFKVCVARWEVPALRERIAYGMLHGCEVWWNLFAGMAPYPRLEISEWDPVTSDAPTGEHSQMYARRKSERIPCDFGAILQIDDKKYDVRAVSLSRGGVQTTTPHKLDLDQRINVSLMVPGMNPVDLEVAVRSIHDRDDSLRLGFEFQFRDNTEREFIKTAVRKVRRQG